MNKLIRDRGRPYMSLCDHNHCFRYNDTKIDTFYKITKPVTWLKRGHTVPDFV